MYRVQLQNFEGPLDLLLFFIKRDELDIYDIPISYITEQFLDYINFLDELDLTIASEFIYMASTLMSIKARMMLSQPDDDDGEELDEHDPRYELVQSLLEYKRYKEMGEEMRDMDYGMRKNYFRGHFEPDRVDADPQGEALHEVTMVDLMAAFRQVMVEKEEEVSLHNVQPYETTIEKQSVFVVNTLQRSGRLSFLELCVGMKTRIMVIITFMAVLELAKEQQIELFAESDSTQFHVDLPPASSLEQET